MYNLLIVFLLHICILNLFLNDCKVSYYSLYLFIYDKIVNLCMPLLLFQTGFHIGFIWNFWNILFKAIFFSS